MADNDLLSSITGGKDTPPAPHTDTLVDSITGGSDTPQKPSYAGEFADYMFGKGSLKSVSDAFIGNLQGAAAGSDETLHEMDAWGKKVGIYNEDSEHHDNLLKTFNEAYIRPAVNGIVAGGVLGMGALQAGTEALGELGQAVGTADRDRQAQGMPATPFAAGLGAAGEFASEVAGHEDTETSNRTGEPLNDTFTSFLPEFAHSIHDAHPVTSVYDARSKGQIGEGEPGFFNTRRVTPENQTAREDFARQAGKETIPEGQPPEKDINVIARQVNPEVFKEYDEKVKYHEELTQRLADLQPPAEHLELPDYQKSSELEQAEEAFNENQARIQELQPAVNDTLRHAQYLLPDEGMDKERPILEEGEEKEDENTLSQTEGSTENAFSAAVKDKIQREFGPAGYGDEHISALSQLVEAQINTRSKLFGGKIGSPEEILERDFPEVKVSKFKNREAGEKRTFNQYVGTKAFQENDQKLFSLNIAKKMEASGKEARDIQFATGWHKGLDGKWKAEISDEGADLAFSDTSAMEDLGRLVSDKLPKYKLDEIPKTSGFDPDQTFPLSAILHHPELFEHYPDAKDIRVKRQSGLFDMFQGMQGWYDDKTNTINVTPYAKEPLSTLLHEIQHWIQNKEGFARGGNVQDIVRNLTNQQLKDAFNETINKKGMTAEEIYEAYRHISENAKGKDIAPVRDALIKEEELWQTYKSMHDLPDTDPTKLKIRSEWNAKRAETRDLVKNMFFDGKPSYELKDAQSRAYWDLMEYLRDPSKTFPIDELFGKFKKELVKIQEAVANLKAGNTDVLKEQLPEDRKFAFYQAIAGEIEARDTQARKNMSPEERKRTSPLSSQMDKINPKDITVSFTQDEKPAAQLHQAVRKDRLRVARRMPDGTVKIGAPGELHLDLIDDDEMERKSVGHVGIQESDMGFADPEGNFLSRQEAMKWVNEHNPEVNPELAAGGPRDKDKLESTGYEKELDKAAGKTKAETALPPHLDEGFKTNPAKIRQEHEAEVSSLWAQGTKRAFGKRERTFNQGAPGEIPSGLDHIFHSALRRGIEGLSQGKAHPDQWVKTIDNMKGVTKDEIADTHVKEYLEDRKAAGEKSVSKKEIQDYLHENKVNLEESELREHTGLSPKELTEYRALADLDNREQPLTAEQHRRFNELDERWNGNYDKAKYGVQRLKGGEDYRELLLQIYPKKFSLSDEETQEYEKLYDKEYRGGLSDEEMSEHTNLVDKRIDARDKVPGVEFTKKDADKLESLSRAREKGSLSPEDRERLEKLRDKQDELSKKEEEAHNNAVQDSHWFQKYVAAHSRFDTRMEDGKKVLHVAEIQSTINQPLFKMGLRKPMEEIKKLRQEADKLRSVEYGLRNAVDRLENHLDRLHADPDTTPEKLEDGKRRVKEAQDERDAHRTKALDAENAYDKASRGVPDNPLKYNWHEVMMKRLIRYAAENGFDKLSWDTGTTNALRARQAFANVKEIRWHPETHRFEASTKDGAKHVLHNITEDKLADYIGRDAANDLVHAPVDFEGQRVLDTDNITVGGKGMRNFYDEKLVNFANKYTRKWGGKVEEGSVSIPENNRKYTIDRIGNAFVVYDIDRGGEIVSGRAHATHEEAQREINELTGEQPVKTHSLPITPEMKSAVLGDTQPLYQGTKRGSMTIRETRDLLQLFEKADVTTPYHELSHHWLEQMVRDSNHPDAPYILKRNVQEIFDFIGAKKGRPISKASHEMFAETLERYLRTGSAPSEGLKAIFEKFKEWFRQVYQTITGLGKPISPAMKTVFDQMFATPEETAEMGRKEKARSLQPVEGGEKKARGLSANILARATENGLENTYGDLPEYGVYDKTGASLRAAQMVTEDPEAMKAIAMGDEPAPKGITPETILKAVEAHATATGDFKTLEDLWRHSKLTSDATTMGQRLGSLADRDEGSPIAALKKIQRSRDKMIEKRTGSKAIEKEQDEIGAAIDSHTQPVKPQDFTSFIRSLECDY